MKELGVHPKQLVSNCRKREVNTASIVKNKNILKRQLTSSAHPRKHENGEGKRERECFPEVQ